MDKATFEIIYQDMMKKACYWLEEWPLEARKDIQVRGMFFGLCRVVLNQVVDITEQERRQLSQEIHAIYLEH